MNLTIKLFFVCFQCNFILCQLNKKNFGPYKPTWEVYTTCKGLKPADCGLYQILDSSNMSNVHIHLEIDKECPVTMARVVISQLQANNKKKKLFNYGLDKPCQHFVLGPVLIDSLHLDNECKINKGHYEVHLNMMEKTTTFLGPAFFYGTYEFKFMAFNKERNLACIDSVISVKKS